MLVGYINVEVEAEVKLRQIKKEKCRKSEKHIDIRYFLHQLNVH